MRSRKASHRSLVFVFFFLLGTYSQGYSDEKFEQVGILSLETSNLSESAKNLFEASLEEGLIGLGYDVAHFDELGEKTKSSDFIKGCTFGPCLKKFYLATDIGNAIVARMKREGSSYHIVISHLDTKRSALESQVAELCEVCTVEEAMLTVTNAVIAVMTETGEAKDNEATDIKKAKKAQNENREKKFKKHSSFNKMGLAYIGVGIVSMTAGLVARAQSKTPAMLGFLGLGVGAVLGGSTMVYFSRRF